MMPQISTEKASSERRESRKKWDHRARVVQTRMFGE